MLLLSTALFANTDSCKLDVYFGNGVWNEAWQAENSMKKLKKFMQTHDPVRFAESDYGTTYNSSTSTTSRTVR
jgi:hypothetical protein